MRGQKTEAEGSKSKRRIVDIFTTAGPGTRMADVTDFVLHVLQDNRSQRGNDFGKHGKNTSKKIKLHSHGYTHPPLPIWSKQAFLYLRNDTHIQQSPTVSKITVVKRTPWSAGTRLVGIAGGGCDKVGSAACHKKLMMVRAKKISALGNGRRDSE